MARGSRLQRQGLRADNISRARTRYASSTAPFMLLGVVVVVLAVLQMVPVADASGNHNGANRTSGDYANDLARMAKACSETFCSDGVSGLDLWVSLNEVCAHSSQPSSLQALDADYGSISVGIIEGWSFLSATLLCSAAATLGLFGGFRLGSAVAPQQKMPYYPLL